MLLTLEAVAHAEPASGRVFSDAGPDAEAYRAAKGFPVLPVGQPATQECMIGWHSHYDRIRPIRASPKLDCTDDGRQHSIGDYLDHNTVMGLMIARDDSVLVMVQTAVRTEDRGPRSAEVIAL
jgi:hypothetical protein